MLLCLLLSVSSGLAEDHGQTGSYATGCGSCHGSSASASVTATLSASATTVAPGEMVSLSFVVSSADSAHTHAGLNVGSASGGTFAAGANNQLRLDQITHRSPTAMSGGAVTFPFTWTAPSVEGTYTLQGAGNAVNGDGLDSGDGWALAADLSLTVDDGCDDLDGDGVEDCDGDCDDGDASIAPDAIEQCDEVDNDCDGAIDEDDAADTSTWYNDGDGDGYGADSATTVACDRPEGYAAAGGDCADEDAAYNPGASETCDDPADYNCDGATGYVDNDGDGWAACAECDDYSAAANPGQTEICDGADNDCDGAVDGAGAADASTWYVDEDGDGWGDKDQATVDCEAPGGSVASGGDCDDLDRSANPDGTEICDGADDDCDSETDEDAIDADRWYNDADGDGYGDAGSQTTACDAPDGHVDNSGDCDDTHADVNPGEDEIWYDGTDQDCDAADDDQDGDGAVLAEDCDDTDASVQRACDSGGMGGSSGGDGGGTGSAETPTKEEEGCGGCSTGGPSAGLLLLGLALLGLRRRTDAADASAARRRG